jgi:hypothetical protein
MIPNPNEEPNLVFHLPTAPGGKFPPGARIKVDFDCTDCGTHYTRIIEPVEQIIAVDCPCGAKIGLTIRPPEQTLDRIHRNAPCPCGSGKKFKHCCKRTST